MFASTHVSANTDSSFKQLLREKLLTLNIKSVSEYPNLYSPHIIKGSKLNSKDFDNITNSNLMLFRLLKKGIDLGNLSNEYLSNSVDWVISPISDMQPDWRVGYKEWYFPKYYAIAPAQFNKEDIVDRLLADIPLSSYSYKDLYYVFDKIFDQTTPIYINDVMFSANADKTGFYLTNLLGMNRFNLPVSSNAKSSIIHIANLNFSIKTLIHEFLHVHIRMNGYPDHLMLALYSKNNDISEVAFNVRNIINDFANNKKPSLSTDWITPLSNTLNGNKDYSFTYSKKEHTVAYSPADTDKINSFIEEFLVRVISESFFTSSGSINEVISHIPKLESYLENINASVAINDFAHSFLSRK